MDLRGYGWSKAMTGAYSVDEAAADGLRLMDHRGLVRFHVVGHSMSGMIAQKFPLTAPSRVRSVVAICPVPASGFKADEKTMAALRTVIEDDAAAKNAILARGGTRYGNNWVNFKLALARRASTQAAMHGYLKMFTGTDFAAQARANRTPILALVGKHDIPFYREESVRKNFEPLYPNFSLVVCEEAGHYPMLEAPVFVAGTMEKFFATVQTTNTTGQIRGGKIKVYGVTTKARVGSLAEVPALQEQGLKGFEVGVWHALYTPMGTPQAVLDKLVAALQHALKDPTVKARFNELGTDPIALDKTTRRRPARASAGRDRQMGAAHQKGGRVRRLTMIDRSEKHRSPTRNTLEPLAFRATDAKQEYRELEKLIYPPPENYRI